MPGSPGGEHHHGTDLCERARADPGGTLEGVVVHFGVGAEVGRAAVRCSRGVSAQTSWNPQTSMEPVAHPRVKHRNWPDLLEFTVGPGGHFAGIGGALWSGGRGGYGPEGS